MLERGRYITLWESLPHITRSVDGARKIPVWMVPYFDGIQCFVLFCFVLFCVGNAIFTQYIFQESELQSLFILSYIGGPRVVRRGDEPAKEAQSDAMMEADSFDGFQDDLSRFQ